jgi:class 3 adenylate cyclase
MTGAFEGGALDRFSLRFLDRELEQRFQCEEGEGAQGWFGLTAGASAVLWAIAALILPIGTDVPADLAYTVGFLMSAAAIVCVVISRWARTLNRQHGLIGLLTAANGIVIISLASVTGVVHGYAVAAIMLLFSYGFIARTRFVFAFLRTAAIAVAFAIVVVQNDGASLVLDTFIFVAVSIGTLLALRRLERDRRQVYYQALVIQQQADDLQRYSDETDRLLLNVLPASVSVRLRAGESPIADEYASVSVLFADMVGFTPLAAKLSPREVITLLSDLFTEFDSLVAERGLEKIKTIGDAYMVAGGLPEPLEGHANKVVDLGLAMVLVAERFTVDLPDIALRVGIHSGPAAGGVIGTRRFAYDVWGDTVNVASRLEESGIPGKVHVSEATRMMVTNWFAFEARGPVSLQGVGSVNTYLVSPHPMTADNKSGLPVSE